MEVHLKPYNISPPGSLQWLDIEIKLNEIKENFAKFNVLSYEIYVVLLNDFD